jgi:hypothetical protein
MRIEYSERGLSVNAMTKVTLHFKLLASLDEKLMAAIARAGSIYGLQRVHLTPSMDGLIVDFDASRLSVAEVEATLGSIGLPLQRVPAVR